jgi:serine/threonine protein phosphatase PrpC
LKFEVSSASNQGGRKTMEDTHITIPFLNEYVGLSSYYPPQAFIGVYDGHSGNAAADYSRTHLRIRNRNTRTAYYLDISILSNEKFLVDINQAFEEAYKKTETDFNEIAVLDALTAGTTTVSILIREDVLYPGDNTDESYCKVISQMLGIQKQSCVEMGLQCV